MADQTPWTNDQAAPGSAPATDQTPPAADSAPASTTTSGSVSVDPAAGALQVAQLQRAQAAAQPQQAPPPVPDFPKWAVGQLVIHRWTDPHGDKDAYGQVLAVIHQDGVEDRVEVLWLNASRSGPMLASTLEDPFQDPAG